MRGRRERLATRRQIEALRRFGLPAYAALTLEEASERLEQAIQEATVPSARAIAESLRARSRGSGRWMARCPAHDDRTPSLDIRGLDDQAARIRCYAGCSKESVLEALSLLGLRGGEVLRSRDPARVETERRLQLEEDKRKTAAAVRLWQASRSVQGTLGERYLRARSISLPLSDRIRFHPHLKHRDDRTKPPIETWHPGLVVLVTDLQDEPVTVHRIFLAPDGSDKADVYKPRKVYSKVMSGAVRLWPATEQIVIAEGIETALAASELSGIPAWSALSAGGMERLELPDEVRSVLIAADRDENGTGQKAAIRAAERWIAEGRDVRIEVPPQGLKDFNDLLAAQRPQRSKVMA